MTSVRWDLLSTASIGATVVEATRHSELTEFVAVAGREADRAAAFAGRVGIGESFGSYEELLASDGVEAVYVALPLALHTEWTVPLPFGRYDAANQARVLQALNESSTTGAPVSARLMAPISGSPDSSARGSARQ